MLQNSKVFLRVVHIYIIAMKKKYYVNTKEQVNGDHEVHEEGCIYMPGLENRRLLGEFSNCHDAVNEAKKFLSQVNGCIYCSTPCHTG